MLFFDFRADTLGCTQGRATFGQYAFRLGFVTFVHEFIRSIRATHSQRN